MADFADRVGELLQEAGGCRACESLVVFEAHDNDRMGPWSWVCSSGRRPEPGARCPSWSLSAVFAPFVAGAEEAREQHREREMKFRAMEASERASTEQAEGGD